MTSLPDKINFSTEEEKILALWQELNAFQRSLELSKGKPEYTFYDGPPFATGLPHYGHILAGTIKDIVTRYATQTGHYVSRRFGWDCHGLPVEFEIDKKLDIKGRDEVMKMGIANYNKECKSIVTRYCAEWETIVTRMGRWIDFKNDYKTMEPWYMESVWWVFSQLWKKNLVYRSFRVMPYSTACNTPLSNFEAGLNYKDDTSDPAVVVTFPILTFPNNIDEVSGSGSNNAVGAGGVGSESTSTTTTSFVAWTTTPWTLPTNLALCVNPTLTYALVKDLKSGNRYICLEARVSQLYPKAAKKDYKGGEFEIVRKYVGKDLVGATYTPLFSYFVEEYGAKAFRVVSDAYVSDDAGTGIVHQAPAFGEDDFRVCAAHGVIEKDSGRLPCPLDVNGRFTSEVPDFVGQYVKAADDGICAKLKEKGRLFSKGSIIHSYPFCWRSETPLIYRAVPSWFVRVESIKERLLASNDATYWVPPSVREGRFHNWLKDARDWNISRNRYWGTPLPIWVNEDYTEMRCFGSIAELEEACGQKVTDLHREFIDHLEVPSATGNGVLRRIDEVFDCWFESGAMPYAQIHYPFENSEGFLEKRFPADFIAEGLDQTRGWFYTLTVLSTALFDKPAFKNLIVNGLVLAEDGKKMSKRLKNYPDPMDVVKKYGADALRLYLIDSPVVRAEPLRFKEAGVLSILKDLFLPWYNALRFFSQNASRLARQLQLEQFVVDPKRGLTSTNAMDRWVIAATQGLIQFVRAEMAAYRLYTVVPRLVSFINDLTNWYVRLNRRRLKGAEGDDNDANTALCVLHSVLLDVAGLMAPFTPFLTELQYQHLRGFMAEGIAAMKAKAEGKIVPEGSVDHTAVGVAESIHFTNIPDFNASLIDSSMEARVRAMMTAIELGRTARDKRTLSLKIPVRGITVIHPDPAVVEAIRSLGEYITDELNALSLTVSSAEDDWATLAAEPNLSALGKRLGKDLKAVGAEVKAWKPEQVRAYMASGTATVVGGHVLTGTDVKPIRQVRPEIAGRYECLVDESSGNPLTQGNLLVILDVLQDDETRAMGYAREVANRVQKLRKKADLQLTDIINISYSTAALSATQWDNWVAGKAAAGGSGATAGGGADEDTDAAVGAGATTKVVVPAGTIPLSTGQTVVMQTGSLAANVKTGYEIEALVRGHMFGTYSDPVIAAQVADSSKAAAEHAEKFKIAILKNINLIRDTTRMPVVPETPFTLKNRVGESVVGSLVEIVGGVTLSLTLTRAGLRFPSSDSLLQEAAVASGVAAEQSASIATCVREALLCRNAARVCTRAAANHGVVSVGVEGGKTVNVTQAVHFFASIDALLTSSSAAGVDARAKLTEDLGADGAASLVKSMEELKL